MLWSLSRRPRITRHVSWLIWSNWWATASRLRVVQRRRRKAILGAAILGDMALVAQGALSVSAIAWTIDPSHYHRLAGLVRDKVGHLRDAGLLVICPDDELRLNSHVLPSESTMDNFLVFLREEDPITDKEIRETLYRIT